MSDVDGVGTGAGTGAGRIDTHHHVLPPAYRQWLLEAGATAGGRGIPEWSAARSLQVMDDNGIRAAILSVSTPGVHLGPGVDANADARTWARRVNDQVAEVVKDRPDRFGFFATLTLPDVDGALAEAAHALDELGADGVVLLSSVAGTYLGDPAFEPLFSELAARDAVVFVHPSEPQLAPVPGVPAFAADFLLDTTRAALNLVRSGTLTRHPDLRIILSHGGGFLPYVADRVAPLISPDGTTIDGHELLRRFYFDLALSSGPSALPSLLRFADPARLTYGSDFPYAYDHVVASFRQRYEEFEIEPRQRAAIDTGNATRLFPRLAATPAGAPA